MALSNRTQCVTEACVEEDEVVTHEEWLSRAIELATQSVASGGGPFGAVVVREGVLVAEGMNRVAVHNDPTAHAEVEAIRAACRGRGDFVLDGCVLYSSCEPCPMCLGAVHWARLDAVYFAATRGDAAAAGFDDARLYEEFARSMEARDLPTTHCAHRAACRPFDAWRALEGRTNY